MHCDTCGAHAPTKYVELYQNIGMLVLRSSKSVKGDLCKPCINRYFWQFTLVTAVVGWWGMISMIVTPIFLANNIFRFCTTLRMPLEPASPGRLPPIAPAIAPHDHPTLSLTPEAVERLKPFEAQLRDELAAGGDLERVAEAVARRARVSAVQAELFATGCRPSPPA